MTEIGEDPSERKVCQVLRRWGESLWRRLTERVLRYAKQVADHELGFGPHLRTEVEE